MIVFRAVVSPMPGKFEEATAAAAAVRDESLKHDGVEFMDFFADEAANELIALEGYRDSQALLDHVARAPFGRLGSLITGGPIEVFGDPSDEAVAIIQKFGSARLRRPI